MPTEMRPGRVSRVRKTPAGDFDYEAEGQVYARRRRADPRIAALVHGALGNARTVINVGAGAGSYEPTDRHVVAVEPSAAMRAQRPAHLAPAVDAAAEQLPFDGGSFEAGMATLTIHQWSGLERGLAELRRVSRGTIVILTFDAQALNNFWLAEYFPEVIAVEQRRYPEVEQIAAYLGGRVAVSEVPVPFDCQDGFGDAYYGRPEAFLDRAVRRAQSGFRLADPNAVADGVARLEQALRSGQWDRHHGHLRTQAERIGALRMVVAQS
jgi:SAM-dependent methyltransferase